MEPTLTADQLSLILQRLLRLNPARLDLALRTFGRRRRHFQLMQQPGSGMAKWLKAREL